LWFLGSVFCFRVSGLGVLGSGFGVQDSGRVSGFGVQGSGSKVEGSGFRVQGLWFAFEKRVTEVRV